LRVEPGASFCAEGRVLRAMLAPAAFDWMEIILVVSGTGWVTHRDEGLTDPVRPGCAVVLAPNTPCGLVPEGELSVTRVFLAPSFVVQQTRWAHPQALADDWAAWRGLERAVPSQVVRVEGARWEQVLRLAKRIAEATAAGAVVRRYWRAAAWVLGVMGAVDESARLGNQPGGLFCVEPLASVSRPSEPCFGKLTELAPEVREALAVIGRNYAETVRLGDLAARAGLSRSGFARLFTEQVGKTPKAYQNLLRVKHMTGMLTDTRHPVAAIARQAGWANTARAAQVFEEATSMRPAAYRARFAVARRANLDTKGPDPGTVRLVFEA
jgi:AraC-like DNA-binding protein